MPRPLFLLNLFLWTGLAAGPLVLCHSAGPTAVRTSRAAGSGLPEASVGFVIASFLEGENFDLQTRTVYELHVPEGRLVELGSFQDSAHVVYELFRAASPAAARELSSSAEGRGERAVAFLSETQAPLVAYGAPVNPSSRRSRPGDDYATHSYALPGGGLVQAVLKRDTAPGPESAVVEIRRYAADGRSDTLSIDAALGIHFYATALSPDGRWLAMNTTMATDGVITGVQLLLFDTARLGAPVETEIPERFQSEHLFWSSDGDAVFVGGPGDLGSLPLADLREGHLQASAAATLCSDLDVAYDTYLGFLDSEWVVYQKKKGVYAPNSELWACPADGGAHVQLAELGEVPAAVAFGTSTSITRY